jgi:FHA domain-containing protein/cohesin domain-containing protein
MKSISVFVLALILTLVLVMNVGAQSSESIWLTANTTSYKTNETVIVAVNGTSATPIQGFTFQIRYDPACLQPVNAVSTIPGMNALPLPQLAGLADGSYASTTPQAVNGVLAEVRFTALKGCQTNLILESAALAVRNESGFAAPVPNVVVDQKNVPFTIDKEAVAAQSPESLAGSVLPLTPPAEAASKISGWMIALAAVLVIGLSFGAFKLFRIGSTTNSKPVAGSPLPVLQMKHGPNAGEAFKLNKLPCFIGRHPMNEICLNDPHIIDQHAKIFRKDNGFYLMDLGGETFINGQAVRRSSTPLKSGDVVRLGKSALFVFGS